MIDQRTSAYTKLPLALFCAGLLLIFAAQTASAQDAGSVIFAKGDVSAERQPPEALAKGDAVRASDTVVTGAASRAQLLMIDGAKIALRPDSRLAIAEYSHTPAPTAGAAVSANNDSAVMELVKGGFRTITGAIGKQDEANYEVRTAVGVLGIRGTDYSAVFCNGDCNWVPGGNAGSPVADGLYLGVTAGRIVFRTSTQTIELSSGEYAFIPLDSPEPQRLDAPPAVLLDDNDLRFDPDGDSTAKPGRDDGKMEDDGSAADDSGAAGGTTGGGRTGFDPALGTRRAPAASAVQAGGDSGQDPDDDSSSEAPKQPTLATDPDGTLIDITPGTQPDPRGNRTISFSTSPLGAVDTFWSATLENQPDQFRLDIDNNVIGFAGLYPANRTAPDIGDFDINSSANVETGFDSMTVMRWGRWSGGSVSTTLPNGTVVTDDLGFQSLHWVSGPEGAPPVMPITGVANYTLIGNTSPTDDLGNVGTLGSATFQADFTNMLVSSTLDLTINGSNWTASGNGTIGAQAGLAAHLFQGLYGNVSVDGIAGGSGIFSGFFSGPGPTSNPLFPGAAGLTFSLQNEQGTASVSGAAVFGNP